MRSAKTSQRRNQLTTLALTNSSSTTSLREVVSLDSKTESEKQNWLLTKNHSTPLTILLVGREGLNKISKNNNSKMAERLVDNQGNLQTEIQAGWSTCQRNKSIDWKDSKDAIESLSNIHAKSISPFWKPTISWRKQNRIRSAIKWILIIRKWHLKIILQA